MGAGVSLTLFLLLVPLSSLNRRALALTYCILFSPLWLLSSGNLIFSEEESEGEWIWGTQEVWGS